MPNRSELKKLAINRIEEAKALHKSGFYDSAIYIAGYSIELALKAVICKKLDWVEFTPKNLRSETAKVFKIHDFLTLAILGGVWSKIETETSINPVFQANCNMISKWSEGQRYDAIGTNDKTKSKDFIDAIENSTDGVFFPLKNDGKNE